MPNVAFWQEDVVVTPPSNLPTITWNDDQLTGETGRWWSEVPVGSEASAGGTWGDDDASPSTPIQDIWVEFQGRRFGQMSFSDPTATTGTWSISTSDFQLSDDTYPATVYILDFNGNVESATVQVLLNHNNPQQTLIGHSNRRQDDTRNYWEYIFDGNPTSGGSIPSIFTYSPEFMYRVPKTGYGVFSYIQPAANAMIETLKATEANGYAGRAVKPQWQVAIPAGVTLVIEQAVVNAAGTARHSEDTWTFEGPIDFTGYPDEINISIPKIDLELNETVRLRIYTVGSDPFDFNTLGIYGYANHLNVSQAAPAAFTDVMGLFVDPVNGDDSTGTFGDITKPYKSYWHLSTDAFMATLPAGTKENPINVYQPRGTVAEWGEKLPTPTGDGFLMKDNVFHMQPWPDTWGQAPTLRGHRRFPLTSGDPTYGKQNGGLLGFRDCQDSIIEQFIVEDSRTAGIQVKVSDLSPYGTKTCRGNTVRSCIIKRTGADGFVAEGRDNPASQTAFTTNPVEDTIVEYMDIYEANYAWTGDESFNVVTGQAFTVLHCVGFYGHHLNCYDHVKEGFDVISSRNVLLEDLYCIREPLNLYNTNRGAQFYSDAQAEGNYNVVFRRGLSERGAYSIVFGSEASGPSVGVVFESIAAYGNTASPVLIGRQEVLLMTPTYTDCALRNCTIVAENQTYCIRSTTAGDPSGILMEYNIFKGNRQNLFLSDTTLPTLDKNLVWTTNPSGLSNSSGGHGTNVINQDPLLLSSTDLRIGPNSPAANLINAPKRSYDLDGNYIEFIDSYGAYSAPTALSVSGQPISNFNELDDIGDLVMKVIG